MGVQDWIRVYGSAVDGIDVGTLNPISFMVLVKLWIRANTAGMIPASLTIIQARIDPHHILKDKEILNALIDLEEGCNSDGVARGLLSLVQADNTGESKHYILIKNFMRWQKNRWKKVEDMEVYNAVKYCDGTIREYFQSLPRALRVTGKVSMTVTEEGKQAIKELVIKPIEDKALLNEFNTLWVSLGFPKIENWEVKMGKETRGSMLCSLLSTEPWTTHWQDIIRAFVTGGDGFWRKVLAKQGIRYLLEIKSTKESGRDHAIDEWGKWKDKCHKAAVKQAQGYMDCQYLPAEIYEALTSNIYNKEQVKAMCDGYLQQRKDGTKVDLKGMLEKMGEGKVTHDTRRKDNEV